MTPKTDKLSPALTAWEWSLHRLWEAGKMLGGKLPGPDPYNMRPENRHAVAARMLDGQPFGFTREDVELCRGQLEHPDSSEIWIKLESLANRIEALLPPEGE